MTKKIISFCLFGTDKCYYTGALENLFLSKNIFPGWICRYYISQEVPLYFIDLLKKGGAEVVLKQREYLVDAMMWRYLPASDKEVGVFIARDLDARLSEGDFQAVNQWLMSNKKVHIIRDHPCHMPLMLGGLVGFKAEVVADMEGRIEDFKKNHNCDLKNTDQIFLAKCIYPLVKNDIFVHSEFVKYPGEEAHLINCERPKNTWLGMPFGREDAIFQERLKRFIEGSKTIC